MRDIVRELLHRYARTAVVVMTLGILGVWPMLLAPLGNAYIVFCARYLSSAPFQHHFPPLLVGFVVSATGALGLTLVWCFLRQIVGQREMNRTLVTRREEPEEDLIPLFVRLNLSERATLTRDNAVYAFCGGLLRPQIYLSRGLVNLLTLEELEAVLHHERHHLLRRDPLRLFIGILARPLTPLFPVVAVMADRISIRVELAADRAALAKVPVDVLASALVKVMRAMPVHEHPASVAGLSPTGARVNALLGRPADIAIDRRDVVVSLVVGIMLLTLAMWLTTQSLPTPPQCFTCPSFSVR